MLTSLSDEQRQFVQTVRDLAQSEFRARALKYMDGTFPWENLRQLAELGVLGMAVPEEYGGLGLPVFDTALVLEEIAKVCYVTAMAVLGEVGVQTRIIAAYAPEPIKQRILPAVVSGECLLGDLHDRARRRHRRRQLPDQCRPCRQPAQAERGQDPDQPRRGGRHVRGLHPHRQEAGAGRHRLRAGREGDAGVFGDRHLPHDGRRKSARDPL